MLDGFLLTAQQVGVLFALIAVGYACRKTNFLSDAFVKGCVNLLLLIVTPCLIVHVFQRPFNGARLHTEGQSGVARGIFVLQRRFKGLNEI